MTKPPSIAFYKEATSADELIKFLAGDRTMREDTTPTLHTYTVRYEIEGSDGPAVFTARIQAASFADAAVHVEALQKSAQLDGHLIEAAE